MTSTFSPISPLKPRPSLQWRDRLRAGGVHLLLSLGVAALAGLLVFGLWYPYPYREISGGRELFWLVVSVDVVLGPLITLAVYSRAKPWPVMRRDFIVIVLLQIAALGYGLHTVFVARPVHLVFEYRRFTVVHALDVPQQQIHSVPAPVVAMPLFGPTLLSLRAFKDDNEKIDMTMADLAGVSLAARPELWQPFATARAEVLAAAKPATQLRARFATQKAEVAQIDAAVKGSGRNIDQLLYASMIGRKTFWTVLIDPQTAELLAYLPLDSF